MERRYYDGDPGSTEHRDSADAMVAEGRGFASVAEFRAFRDGSPEEREALIARRERAKNTETRNDDYEDRKRSLELLKAVNYE